MLAVLFGGLGPSYASHRTVGLGIGKLQRKFIASYFSKFVKNLNNA